MTGRVLNGAFALTEGQRRQLCDECKADPKAAPGRYCSRFACLCGHESCWAFDSYIPRKPIEPPVEDNVVDVATRRRRKGGAG